MQQKIIIVHKIMVILNYFICFVLMLTIRSCEGKVQLPNNVVVKAVFAFGDSIVDQGNNNYIPTIAKCNFPPYGKDFNGGIPTGRFCNGKTPPDLIVEELGIKEYVPAYLDSNLRSEDLKTGVSFASGGSGYDPRTSTLASAIPLSTQLNQFKEYIGKLEGLVGEEEANYILKNSLFLVVVGSDDLANTYFTLGVRLKQDIDSYTDLMVAKATEFLQELYNLGARKIGIFGIPPIGCLPSQRTLAGGPNRECAKEYNEAAQLANTKFSIGIDSLSKKLAQSKLVLIDIYNPFPDIIVNPQKYGLEEVEKGCCGTGNIEVTILCNKFSGTCEDDTKYLFWDSYHPTEKGYRILVDQILKKYVNRFL
ncbi:GDSL esterase/lipase EXL3-like [Solanum tuberosum]|nr:PREDICTED: GDSL esterase/lipase EXL3-like [Solanum tuberosum]